MTRFGLEEYVADCVILLDHRVTEQMSTRRLRIVKYRGTLHGTNEYPVPDHQGWHLGAAHHITVGLDHQVPAERVSTGIKELDEMLEAKVITEAAAFCSPARQVRARSSLAAAFVDAACRRGETLFVFCLRGIHASQILRNMRSIGIDLAPHVKKGLLQFHVARPTLYGLEMHLVTMYDLIREHKPQVVVLGPDHRLFRDR